MSVHQRTLADGRAEVKCPTPQRDEAWSWLRDEEADPSAGTINAVDQGTAELSELQDVLSGRRRAGIRAVLGPQVDGGAPLLYALVLVGQAPSQRERKWVYEHLTFVSGSISSRRLASIFVPEAINALTLASTRVTVEFPGTGFMWQKKPSLAQYDQLSLPWPSVIYSPRIAEQININVPGYHIGAEDAPSFPTFGAAFNAFLYDDFIISGTANPSLGEVQVRLVDQRARIRRARIRPASLDVWLGGRSLAGCCLELNGVEGRQVIPVDKPGRVSLPLPTGLPSDAWLWLKHGTEWLDFRALNNWGGHPMPWTSA